MTLCKHDNAAAAITAMPAYLSDFNASSGIADLKHVSVS